MISNIKLNRNLLKIKNLIKIPNSINEASFEFFDNDASQFENTNFRNT